MTGKYSTVLYLSARDTYRYWYRNIKYTLITLLISAVTRNLVPYMGDNLAG